NDQYPMGKRLSIGWYGGIENLNNSALARFIKLGYFQLLGQYFRDGFVITDIANLVQIRYANSGNLRCGHLQVAISTVLLVLQKSQLALQASHFLFDQH